jgi:hypothetical protein
MAAPNPNAAQAVIGALNKVIKYAIGLGAGASALQATLYNGEQQQHQGQHGTMTRNTIYKRFTCGIWLLTCGA